MASPSKLRIFILSLRPSLTLFTRRRRRRKRFSSLLPDCQPNGHLILNYMANYPWHLLPPGLSSLRLQNLTVLYGMMDLGYAHLASEGSTVTMRLSTWSRVPPSHPPSRRPSVKGVVTPFLSRRAQRTCLSFSALSVACMLLRCAGSYLSRVGEELL